MDTYRQPSFSKKKMNHSQETLRIEMKSLCKRKLCLGASQERDVSLKDDGTSLMTRELSEISLLL